MPGATSGHGTADVVHHRVGPGIATASCSIEWQLLPGVQCRPPGTRVRVPGQHNGHHRKHSVDDDLEHRAAATATATATRGSVGIAEGVEDQAAFGTSAVSGQSETDEAVGETIPKLPQTEDSATAVTAQLVPSS